MHVAHLGDDVFFAAGSAQPGLNLCRRTVSRRLARDVAQHRDATEDDKDLCE